jgi:flagellar hook-length control protein FliK
LHELSETARTVIRVAVLEGRTIARITLHPAELGGVEIRLRYEAAGVVAEVIAESEQAAQALAQGVSDLRKSLEAQGIQVAQLDVRHEDPNLSAHRRGLDGHGEGADRRTDGEPLDDAIVRVSRLPHPGSTVDVLA